MIYNPSSLKYASSVLPVLTVEEAKQLQFKLTNHMSKVFTGQQFLSLGDLGVTPNCKRPEQTKRVEQVIANFFRAEKSALVRGAGTGAIRTILSTLLKTGDSMFIHTAPVYTTTKDTIRLLGIQTKAVDYNDLDAVREAVIADLTNKLFYIQHARQQPTDTYNLKELIQNVKRVRPDITIVVDDNYCAMKTAGIGIEFGADYSTFSGFKLLGPEGIGVIVGKKEAITILQERNYSGGGQVQGYEAMELLRMMTFAPVSLAIQNEQVEELCKQLNEGTVKGVASAYMTNAQSKNVIVELDSPIALEVIQRSNALGAATHPVGAESKYEILPMIYRVSGSFLEAQPYLKQYGLRINPMKSSAATVVQILNQAIGSNN
ncbi:aminotransferase class V-fold PLP-dependent enzyme [Virgibacillus pantothenticus]|uniref:aminotransferase class V-fold PLP-dependent enzyme n=1 Tax=Virgibacillus pantothenticus TaxID=1473 RepID=UPI001C219595|nr:aminotransferase class V-fold PLP-dependent enzyme [Virgibacillus pantothenticus]MBU8565007.1 aminotransferase class V-fold PLP-dependent enzyme [Virgibacillus pantothenticus]MBU8599314.1 aminotransferase class V-fold PLP-dependent enzyme [Virgibacillus pantothenticus]MBU8633283.1 aminotransferase class V-fold PLP-dependent enzyme [Virgibacillus pantothenticus]MBU8641056.1 aminotransferase class V-fold PLP-dependent enzyme [Virgibacillus pantothenticus]MBU8645015.1 aminotransferase class V-